MWVLGKVLVYVCKGVGDWFIKVYVVCYPFMMRLESLSLVVKHISKIFFLFV